MNRIAFKVKKAAEKAILQGHPWVYETSITKQSKTGEVGDTAIIFDQRKNQFLALGLYDPDSPIAIRIIHVGSPTKIGPELWQKKLESAYHKRLDLLQTDTTAYRLCYGENDGFPGLIIDVYNQTAVVKLYTAIWLPYVKEIAEHTAHIINLDCVILRLNRKLKQAQTKYTDGSLLLGTLEREEVDFKEEANKKFDAWLEQKAAQIDAKKDNLAKTAAEKAAEAHKREEEVKLAREKAIAEKNSPLVEEVAEAPAAEAEAPAEEPAAEAEAPAEEPAAEAEAPAEEPAAEAEAPAEEPAAEAEAPAEEPAAEEEAPAEEAEAEEEKAK